MERLLPDMPNPEQFPTSELFSLKEWMAAISSKLDRLESKLDTKADVTQVQALQMRVETVEKAQVMGEVTAKFYMPQLEKAQSSIERLEEKVLTFDSVNGYRRWLWGITVSVGLSILGTVTSVIVHVSH